MSAVQLPRLAADAATLDAVEQAVLAHIDADRVVALTSALIAEPSLSGDELGGQALAARQFADAGLEVETFDADLDRLTAHEAYSAEVDRDRVQGVLGRTGHGRSGADGGGSLLIDGHIDVVPTGEPGDWTSPPFEPQVREGRLYGRGACDMKGGLAAAIHAVEAIRAAGVELAGSVTLSSVMGEEDGGSGTLASLLHGVTADACVIPEPTDLAVVPASAGALSWRINVPGRSAHGCLREEGVSAIEMFHVVHDAVIALEARRNERTTDALFNWLDRPFAICGGRIVGGDWPSSEADWLHWEGRYGVAPGEDLATARAEFEAAIAEACDGHPWLGDHPATVTWWGGQFLPGATALDAPIVGTMRAATAAVGGGEPLVRGMPYGCDLGLTLGVGGIPTVVFGPGDVRHAHTVDEFVPVDQLEAVARVLAVTILRSCGVAA